AYKQGDTTYVFFHDVLKIAKVVNDELIETIDVERNFEFEISSKHLPFTLIDSNFILMPVGENLMENPAYVRQNFDLGNLKKYMAKQHLFSLYDLKGNYIKSFGKFPKEYQIEKVT